MKSPAHPMNGVKFFGEWQARQQRQGWPGRRSIHPGGIRSARHHAKQAAHARAKKGRG